MSGKVTQRAAVGIRTESRAAQCGRNSARTGHFVSEEPDLQRHRLQVAQLVLIFRRRAAGDSHALGAAPGRCVRLTRVQRRVSGASAARQPPAPRRAAQQPSRRRARTRQVAYSALIRRAHTAVSTTSAMRAVVRRPDATCARASQRRARSAGLRRKPLQRAARRRTASGRFERPRSERAGSVSRVLGSLSTSNLRSQHTRHGCAPAPEAPGCSRSRVARRPIRTRRTSARVA